MIVNRPSGGQRIQPTAQDLFNRWFREPLVHLELLPEGDGALVALGISCVLYERYARTLIKSTSKKADDAALLNQFAADFSVDASTTNMFWQVIRNGLLHQGIGLQAANRGTQFPEWSVSGEHPRIQLQPGSPGLLKVQPWPVRDRVLELWGSRPNLIDANQSFPWAMITRQEP